MNNIITALLHYNKGVSSFTQVYYMTFNKTDKSPDYKVPTTISH